MPLQYLREAEPFLPSQQTLKLETSGRTRRVRPSSDGTEVSTKRHVSQRSTSLIVSDATIIFFEMLQLLAVIQSMSLKWAWPEKWIKYTNFIFIFNADAWEFIKVQSKAYTLLQGVETASSKIPVSYNYILLAWGSFILLTGLVFLTVFLILRHQQPPYLMVHHAKMERILLLIVQLITFPLGTAVFRLFHCGGGKMAVFNSVSCHKGLYWAYFVPALLVILTLFAVVPIWMVHRIRSQKLVAAAQHHEDYLALKEVEYMAGLDVIWAVQGFHFFSSFRLQATYYRPIVQLAKLIILIIFATASSEIYAQAIAVSVTLSLYAIVVPLVRPFRVTSFNVVLGLSLACLAGDAVFGAVMASVTPATVESPWLVQPYSYWVLAGINMILAGTLLTWLVYLVVRGLCYRRCCPNDPLWPVMVSYAYEVKGMDTYKFMAAVLRGRAVLDTCMRAPSIFAPVHHLSRQIEILNAFCREAEKTQDGFHSTLLQLVDDMTDVFHRLEPVSLFAESVQENIRQNAARFVELMPAFCTRLAQRDYDLILVHPVKKRMLMKMSIIGMFVNGRRQRPVREQLTQDALQQLWEELPDVILPREEIEYGEDLYPAALAGPDTETLYMAGPKQSPLELMDLNDSDEEESLAAFLGRVPPVLVMMDEESRQESRASLLVEPLAETCPAYVDNSLALTTQDVQQQPEEISTSQITSSADREVSQLAFVNEAFVAEEEKVELMGGVIPHGDLSKDPSPLAERLGGDADLPTSTGTEEASVSMHSSRPRPQIESETGRTLDVIDSKEPENLLVTDIERSKKVDENDGVESVVLTSGERLGNLGAEASVEVTDEVAYRKTSDVTSSPEKDSNTEDREGDH